ncbi:bZIP transcription factor [Halarchaeum sp. CBA1220]|uniref:bZIP transcription factor n=1 Tax=Halarchaeum sp. CBA1220 TaxID=1853682 RepID=UPI000F3A9527|nr:bZIP transcription factor [Halarchaeum sp. CBA1220]QLC34069.1 bZIP transcription factor [Halarchaeum sp. CBA1220]
MSADAPSVGVEADDDLRALVEDLADEVRELRAENDALRERVADLEEQREREATVRWAGPNPADIEIVASETGNGVYPYQAITDKVDQRDVEDLEERLTDVEEGRADVVVRSEADPDALPIESRIARQQVGDDGMSANEERAAVVFPTFGGKARTVGGTKLVMSSDDVRQALDEKTDIDAEDWPDETVRRVMRWTAKLTARDDGDRDPRDETNLLTLTKRNGRLTLQAERDEWLEWSEDAAARLDGEGGPK